VPAIRAFLKKAVSWLFVVIGVVMGVFGVSVFAMVPTGDDAETLLKFLGLALFGFVPLLASFIALRNRRRASYLYLLVVPPLGVSILCSWIFPLGSRPASNWADGVGTAAAAAGPCSLLGLFWVITAALRWEPLLASRDASRRRKLALGITGVLILISIFLTTLVLAVHASYYRGECGAATFPVTARSGPDHVVFVGRTIYIATEKPGDPIGIWAIVSVQQHFWGLPWWNRRIVLVRGGFMKGNKTYFVDGERAEGLLTRLVPVVEFRHCGSRTTLLNDAVVDLRMLHDGPPKDGVRIIGRALRFSPQLHRREPAPGAKVLVTGPLGILAVTTDAQGVYDVSGLPPGEYSVTDEPELARVRTSWQQECLVRELEQGQAWGCALFLRDAPGVAAPSNK
jgi:hypothetical protein